MALGLAAGRWATVAGITGYVALAGAGLAWLLATDTDPFAVAVLAATAVGVLAALLARTLGEVSTSVRRMAGDTAVIVAANPASRVDPAAVGTLAPLAVEINRLAAERESAVHGAEAQAEASRRNVESERNRLAALMAQLTVAVVVCNSEGRILLYNAAARSLFGDATPVGLNRSVFGLVDRGLVVHAQARLGSGADEAYTATSLHRDKLIGVHVSLVREPASGRPDAASGFVLVLEDLTGEARAGDRLERLLRELTETTRAALGSIRAAAESVLEFPDLDEAELGLFLGIVRDEADRLGRTVQETARASTDLVGSRGAGEIAGDDLLGVLCNELSRVGVDAVESSVADQLWLRVDGHAVARVVVHVMTRLQQNAPVGAASLTLTPVSRHGQLDVRWSGRAPSQATVDRWLAEPLDPGGTTTAADAVERNSVEIWAGDLDGRSAYLRMLLALADEPDQLVLPAPHGDVGSRPEFYDFDLMTAAPQASDVFDQRLDEMSFTVFDTETTGLDPAAGDRVVSIGAVRVVNGRVLRHETFDRLVQPERSVPAASTAIHGITSDMLEGQPTIAEVLPAFAGFAEDTVLVGHNVSFDLQFLKMAAPRAGVEISQPALDTLLLHAAVAPAHRDHSLEAIAARLGISVVGRHTALGDALVTAEVFLGLTRMLRERGVETLSAALAAARRTYESRLDERLSDG
jgi:DNA polymerase-3 subunit epsilon